MRAIRLVRWNPDAIAKVESHGLTMSDVEEALDTAVGETNSRSSGRPIRFGYALDRRHIAVVFEWLAGNEVLIVTAYETPERT